jgi:VWFA-related protein
MLLKRGLYGFGALLALAVPAWPQAPAGDAGGAQAIFGESIDVRVVNVEAVVTGRDGSRIQGLGPKDFRLVVDGKPVAVDYFTEVHEGEALSPEGGTSTGAAAPSVAAGRVATNYLVFIDDYFGVERRRNEVIRSLAATVARLGANDRMAIVAFDGTRLATLAGWSGSAETLRRALDQALERPAHGLDRVLEARRHFGDEAWVQKVAALSETEDATQSPWLNLRQVSYAELLVRQMEMEVAGIVDTMRFVTPPEGRRVMLLLSGGWPMSVQAFVDGDSTRTPTKEIKEGQEIFRPLTNTANLLGYTIYPVDVPGIEGQGDDSSSLAGVAAGPEGRQDELEASLQFLAQETGGKPLFNSNRTLALSTAMDDTRSYYWLGFSPQWKRNDQRHTIKVEVLKPGAQVRARNGFLDLSKRAEISMLVESALRFGEVAGTLPLQLEIGGPVKGRKGAEIPLSLGIPNEILTAIPVGKRYATQLELRVIAADAQGATSDMPVIDLSLSGDSPPVPGGIVRYATRITLRGRASELMVAVYDPLSGKLASARRTIPVPAKKK